MRVRQFSLLCLHGQKNNKKVDALNANGKTQLFRNLVWRSNAHTAVRKTSSQRERERKKKKRKRKNNNRKTNKQ